MRFSQSHVIMVVANVKDIWGKVRVRVNNNNNVTIDIYIDISLLSLQLLSLVSLSCLMVDFQFNF